MMTHPTALEELQAVKRRVRKLWLPPADISIEEWAEANRVLPSASGRPGQWRADPIQREIQDSCCNPEVQEVVFMKSTRLGWSEICNNLLGWGISVHGMAMLMLQPSRDTAEDYCKERLDQMIESTPALERILRVSNSKTPGSTTRYKRFKNGASFFVASAGNPRELRSKRSRVVIEDEADGYTNDVSNEGDPDKIVRRRMDEFGADARLLIGSTPAMPSGISRIEKAYNRSSQGIYLCPCPHCNSMEAFLWRDPGNPLVHLLKYEKTSDSRVIPESVTWTCIKCGTSIEEKWKLPMMEAGHWHHRRQTIRSVKGYWANALYAVTYGHWAKLAQEWVDAQGDQLELKSFINLNLAETFNEPGESIEKDHLREMANKNDALKRGEVPAGVALLVVQVDVQTAVPGRLEAQLVGFYPDERAVLIDFQVFAGNPIEDEVWEDLDSWLLAGWRHEYGGIMQAHLTLVDARDGNVRAFVYRFCGLRADRWVFPQMGVDVLASKGWAEESSSKKHTQRMFLSATHDLKRTLYSRLALAAGSPRAIILPAWTSKDYLDQIASEKRIPVTNPKTRKTTYQWVKVSGSRNEALDLWVYALSGWWIITRILAPHLSGQDCREQLDALATAANHTPSGASVSYQAGSGRRIRSNGIK